MSAATQDTSNSSNTTSSFVSAAVIGIVVFAAELLLFVILHRKLSQVYKPRVYLSAKDLRAKEIPTNNPISGII